MYRSRIKDSCCAVVPIDIIPAPVLVLPYRIPFFRLHIGTLNNNLNFSPTRYHYSNIMFFRTSHAVPGIHDNR